MRLVLPILLGSAYLESVDAVDKSKFRTCAQGSFCARYRQWASRGKPSPWELRTQFEKTDAHSVTNYLYNMEDGASGVGFAPLSLDIQFFKDSVTNQCGIVRVKVNEVKSMHPRYELPANDVIMEKDLVPDAVKVKYDADHGTAISSKSGDCKV